MVVKMTADGALRRIFQCPGLIGKAAQQHGIEFL